MLRFLLLSFFVVAVPAIADAACDELAPRVKSTWFNYLRNHTNETVYAGTSDLEKDQPVSAGTRKCVHVKAGDDSMTFIYDANNNIKFSTTDYHILDDWGDESPYFILVEWKNGSPSRIKNCIDTMLTKWGDWGFSVDYWGVGNENTNLYRYDPNGLIVSNPEKNALCMRMFEETKNNNPFK